MLRDRLYNSKEAEEEVYLLACSLDPFQKLEKVVKIKERRREDV